MTAHPCLCLLRCPWTWRRQRSCRRLRPTRTRISRSLRSLEITKTGQNDWLQTLTAAWRIKDSDKSRGEGFDVGDECQSSCESGVTVRATPPNFSACACCQVRPQTLGLPRSFSAPPSRGGQRGQPRYGSRSLGPGPNLIQNILPSKFSALVIYICYKLTIV